MELSYCRAALLVATLFVLRGPNPAVAVYDLAPERPVGSLTAVNVQMEVSGELKMVRDGKVQPVPMRGEGKLEYDERLLEAGPKGGPQRSVRNYRTAEATLSIDSRQLRPMLVPGRTLLVAAAESDQQTIFCPRDLLTRDELDLVDVPLSSLLVNDLLPAKAVEVGDRWRHEPETLARLLGLEAVSQAEVESVLGEVRDGAGHVAFSGMLSGAIGGVATEIELKGKYRFDQAAKRIDWVAVLIKENRSVGHAAPGVDVVAKLEMQVQPLASSAALADAALESLPLVPSDELTRLGYSTPGRDLRLSFHRGWQVISDDEQVTVLRLIDRGELVAQCNLSRLPPLAAGKKLTLPEYQQEVQQSLGSNFGQFATAGETTNEAGYHVLRVTVLGQVAALPIEWRYYHITSPSGKRAGLAFTVEQRLAEQLGNQDRDLAAAVRLVEVPATAEKSSDRR